jgi:hypothetical protein
MAAIACGLPVEMGIIHSVIEDRLVHRDADGHSMLPKLFRRWVRPNSLACCKRIQLK